MFKMDAGGFVWLLLVACLVVVDGQKVNAVVNGQKVDAVVEEADVGFPEHERLDVERSSTRIPLYIPGKCPDNQLLYPGNQKNDWVCDCRPAYLYYPPKDGCYPAYRKGPCLDNQHLVLPKGDFNPICTKNPCGKDGFVQFKGQCIELNKPGPPCKPIAEGGGIFGVNTTTLDLECLMGTDRLSIIQVPTNCPPGSQRDRTNRCRQRV